MTLQWFDFIRHGEPVGGPRYRGQRDDPLSELGWQQMHAAVTGYRDWELIVTSPLLRCSAFAHKLGTQLDIPVVEHEGLKEIGFGRWEGMQAEEIQMKFPNEFFGFYLNPLTNTPQGAEPMLAFSRRIESTLCELQQQITTPKVLLVAHAGVIRMVVQKVMQIPLKNIFRLKIPYAGITRIEYFSAGEVKHPNLLFLNGRLA